MRFDVSGAHVHTRSRLLGIIAGLFTVVAAQAAELPVKAKPVQYVKVCTLYGAGFYYIPGTQTCMKIGGFVRAEIKYHAIGSFEPAINGANAQFFRAGDQVDTRARAGISLDTREQTEYGTLRAYLLAGWQYTSNDAPTLSLPGTAVPTAGGAPAQPNGNTLRAQIRPDRVAQMRGPQRRGAVQQRRDRFPIGAPVGEPIRVLGRRKAVAGVQRHAGQLSRKRIMRLTLV